MGRQTQQQRGRDDNKRAIKPSKAGVKKPVQAKGVHTKPNKALNPAKAKAAAAGLIASVGMGAGALNSLLAHTMADLQEAGVVKSKTKQRAAADTKEAQQAAAEMAMEPAAAALAPLAPAPPPPAPAPPRATCAEADALLASWSLK